MTTATRPYNGPTGTRALDAANLRRMEGLDAVVNVNGHDDRHGRICGSYLGKVVKVYGTKGVALDLEGLGRCYVNLQGITGVHPAA